VCDGNSYVSFTGETAELPVCVTSENPDAKLKFNWAGFMLGVYHPDKMILGDTLRSGQSVMALRDVFGSNGISSVRKALKIKYGEKWFDNFEALEDIKKCATPCKLYDDFLNDLHGWFSPTHGFEPIIKMHSIPHLSGGGIDSKFGKDILERVGLSAELDDLFDPPEIMEELAEIRGMSHEERYRTWTGGQRALPVIDPENELYFIDLANDYGIEAKVAGHITERKDYNVALKSKFKGGGWIYF